MHSSKSQASLIYLLTIPGRVGSIEDIAGPAIFLASRAGTYMNGCTLDVGGGRSLVRHFEHEDIRYFLTLPGADVEWSFALKDMLAA